ncbi:hypothetical protein [Chitinibacter sp. S2-10]|uniref:hypothetical protein n=1 Tax=Chitinibacter sp. S2-10 TaxID=3373597 RepID=UPI00397770F6
MKIIVQNAAEHAFNRNEMEAMSLLFPNSWSRSVKEILLCHGREIAISFFPKEQSISFSCPLSRSEFASKKEAITELLIHLAMIAESKKLPRHMSTAERSRLLDETYNLCEKCLAIIA